MAGAGGLASVGVAAGEVPDDAVAGGAIVTLPSENPASLMASIADPNGLPTKPGIA